MDTRQTGSRSRESLRAELLVAHERIAALTAENDRLRAELGEAMNLVELQRADLERYKAEYERIRPNTPERVPQGQLQLAFAQVLAAMSEVPAAKTLADKAAANQDAESTTDKRPGGTAPKNRHAHGRRQLDLESLPVESVVIDPDDVAAADGKGFELIGEEVSDRVAFKPASYVRLHVVRRKWARKGERGGAVGGAPMVIAPVPDSLWPSYMADPSAIAATIISKYDDYLPLHRQERISAREGWRVPRSTQCNWLGGAYAVVRRVVEAMFGEAKSTAFCIATDATGAPVRAEGKCELWHVFVFIADRDHVVFRYTREHTSEAVHGMLGGFRGHLLADAAPVYDVLHREGAIEVACWFHLRRYFWRGLGTEKERALEALSLISKLFEVERGCRGLALPEYTTKRAEGAAPVLELFDAWIEQNREAVDKGGPVAKGIGYYTNQREALRRFLGDGRLRLDNSISEQQLRNAVLGRDNWIFFANETGLKWYSAFRSLIASCRLHGINAHTYLEQLLRLAPHWPVSRVLELAPKYWTRTIEALGDEQRQILVPPWEREWPHASEEATMAAPTRRAACIG